MRVASTLSQVLVHAKCHEPRFRIVIPSACRYRFRPYGVASPHFSYWPRPASRPGGPSRQEKVEERSNATGEAFDAAGGPPARDLAGGAVPPTGCVTPLARCDGIAPRGVPALSGGQRRAGRGQYEKCGLGEEDEAGDGHDPEGGAGQKPGQEGPGSHRSVTRKGLCPPAWIGAMRGVPAGRFDRVGHVPLHTMQVDRAASLQAAMWQRRDNAMSKL